MKREERPSRSARARTAPRGGPELTWPGKRAAERPGAPAALVPVEIHGAAAASLDVGGAPVWRNKLVRADNRAALRALASELAGQVDLVYLDPPFGTGGDFSFTTRGAEPEEVIAYSDRWREGLGDYLSTLLEQLELLRALLSERGTIFVHCDWRVSHYLRCLLDEVFGPDCFKNEIVWRYRRWPARTKAFQKMHDVLFWYTRVPGDRHAWTPLYEALAPSTLETWGTRRQVADFSSGRRKPSQTDEETLGAPMSDVWEIGIIAPIARERVGYPTQKPEALLRRVIEAASKPGDLVADFFAGSGTTLAVAEKLGRRWVGCDVGRVAIHTTKKRLLGLRGSEPPGGDERGCAPFELLADAGEAAVSGSVGEAAGIHVEADGARGVRVALADAEAVDFWAVDWDYRGGPLCASWHAARERRRGALATEARHVYAAPGPYRIAVQLVDAVGSEARRVIEVRG